MDAVGPTTGRSAWPQQQVKLWVELWVELWVKRRRLRQLQGGTRVLKHRQVVLRVVVGTCLGVVALGGCASSAEDAGDGPRSLAQIADDARERGFDWQAEMLEDGDITLAEYDEGHRRNLACLTAAGMTYTDPVRMVPDGFRWDYLIDLADVGEDVGSREVWDCNEEYLSDLEVAMSSWGDWRTDPALLADVEECVSSAGFEIGTGAKNYRDVWLAGADAGLTRERVAICVREGMTRLYPGVDYAVAF